MGTTPNLGYPYPEPTDRVRNGSVAIRSLAEAVDADVDWTDTVAHFALGDSPSTATVAGEIVNYANGSVSLMAGFTNDIGQLTYTGPAPRMFIAIASIQVTNGGDNRTDISSTVYIRQTGVNVAGSHDEVTAYTSVGAGVMQRRSVTHNLTALVLLSPGDKLDVFAYGAPAGLIGQASFKVQPIGGFQ